MSSVCERVFARFLKSGRLVVSCQQHKGPPKAKERTGMFGKIVDYFPAKGFGFIRQAERPADVFFHFTEVRGNPEHLCRDLTVEFSLGERKGKVVARDVRLLESGAADGQQ